MTRAKLIELLEEARFALVSEYLMAGGDEEAAVNPMMKSRGELIDRLDAALADERERRRTK